MKYTEETRDPDLKHAFPVVARDKKNLALSFPPANCNPCTTKKLVLL